MSFNYNAESGQFEELVAQPIDEAAKDQELQAELDTAQNAANTAQANLSNAEEAYKAAEAAAEAASTVLDEHRAGVEVAAAALQKSTVKSAAWDEAKQLRDSQPVAAELADSDGDADGTEEDGESVSEAVEVPVSVVSAEG